MIQSKSFEVKRSIKRFADIPENSLMLIPDPQIVKNYILDIPISTSIDLSNIRRNLAAKYQAEYACPVVTGICLRIVAEATFEDLNNGIAVDKLTPVWRAIDLKSKLFSKLEPHAQDFIISQRNNENI